MEGAAAALDEGLIRGKRSLVSFFVLFCVCCSRVAGEVYFKPTPHHGLRRIIGPVRHTPGLHIYYLGGMLLGLLCGIMISPHSTYTPLLLLLLLLLLRRALPGNGKRVGG